MSEDTKLSKIESLKLNNLNDNLTSNNSNKFNITPITPITPTTLNNSNNFNNSILPRIDIIETFAKSVANSTFANAFKVDGKVNIGDIVANIVLGNELGITPAASLSLGKKLNANSYFSVLRGKELGLDVVTSMSKIYILPTSRGDIIALDVSIITKAILDKGVEMEIIRDYAPTAMYKTLSGVYLGHKYLLSDKQGNLKPDYFLYNPTFNTDEEVVTASEQHKIIMIESGLTRVTSIRFIRKSHNINEIFHYSIQDAIDAELHRGYHSTLLDTKGKPLYFKGRDNWNKHPQTMLRNRDISIAGRIIVSDALQGSYSIEEAEEIKNNNQ